MAHVQALPGNPYDGHTLATVIPALEQILGVELARAVVDAGNKGHHAPKETRFRVYVALAAFVVGLARGPPLPMAFIARGPYS